MYQIEIAKTLEDAKSEVKVMRGKGDIAAVEQEAAEYRERKNSQNEKEHLDYQPLRDKHVQK